MSRKLKLSYDAAFEEVVADSCESFLVGEYLRNNKDSNVAYHSSNNTVIFATD